MIGCVSERDGESWLRRRRNQEKKERDDKVDESKRNESGFVQGDQINGQYEN